MTHTPEGERRNEELCRDIREGILKLGFGYVPTDEEKVEIEKRRRRINRRREFFEKLLSGLRSVFYPPLSIAFHVVSFVTKGIGCITSIGLIAGVYYLYQSFSALFKGVPFAEIETFSKAVPVIIVPFIAFAVSVVTEKIYCYFEDNAF